MKHLILFILLLIIVSCKLSNQEKHDILQRAKDSLCIVKDKKLLTRLTYQIDSLQRIMNCLDFQCKEIDNWNNHHFIKNMETASELSECLDKNTLGLKLNAQELVINEFLTNLKQQKVFVEMDIGLTKIKLNIK